MRGENKEKNSWPLRESLKTFFLFTHSHFRVSPFVPWPAAPFPFFHSSQRENLLFRKSVNILQQPLSFSQWVLMAKRCLFHSVHNRLSGSHSPARCDVKKMKTHGRARTHMCRGARRSVKNYLWLRWPAAPRTLMDSDWGDKKTPTQIACDKCDWVWKPRAAALMQKKKLNHPVRTHWTF